MESILVIFHWCIFTSQFSCLLNKERGGEGGEGEKEEEDDDDDETSPQPHKV